MIEKKFKVRAADLVFPGREAAAKLSNWRRGVCVTEDQSWCLLVPGFRTTRVSPCSVPWAAVEESYR